MTNREFRSFAPFILIALIFLFGFLIIGSPFESLFYPMIFVATLTFQVITNISFKSLGLDFPSGWKKSTLAYYSLALLSVSFHVAAGIVIGGLLISGLTVLTPEVIGFILMAQFVQFGVGFFEEYLFRGYILAATELYGRRASLSISSISFSLLHVFAIIPYAYPVESIIIFIFNMFLGGWTLALIRQKTSSLIPPIAFHASWNFFGYHLYGLTGSEITFFNATYLMPDILVKFEFSLITTIIFAALIFALSFAGARDQDSNQNDRKIAI
ncbi:MAG: type II CAAX prenyl endopeptidase Rce1 family protein [Promethearchaeota archaeon]